MPKKIGKSEKNFWVVPSVKYFANENTWWFQPAELCNYYLITYHTNFILHYLLPKSNFMQRNSIGNRRKMSNILKKLGDLNACTSELNARLDWQNDSFLTLSSLWLDLFVIIIIQQQRLLFKLFSLISFWRFSRVYHILWYHMKNMYIHQSDIFNSCLYLATNRLRSHC